MISLHDSLHAQVFPMRLQTKHCDVYFSCNFELAAQTALEAAEDAIADCSDISSSRMMRRIQIHICGIRAYPYRVNAGDRVYVSYHGNRDDLSVSAYRAVAELYWNRYFAGQNDIVTYSKTAAHPLSASLSQYQAERSVKYRYPRIFVKNFQDPVDPALLKTVERNYGYQKITSLVFLVRGGYSPRKALRLLTPYSGRSSTPNVPQRPQIFRNIVIDAPPGSSAVHATLMPWATVITVEKKTVIAPPTAENDPRRAFHINAQGRLVYAWYNAKESGIRLYSRNGTLEKAFKTPFISLAYPLYDGKALYFCAGKNNGTDIIRLSNDGNTISSLTDNAETESYPSIDPASGTLYYCAGDNGYYRECLIEDGKSVDLRRIAEPDKIRINAQDKSLQPREQVAGDLPLSMLTQPDPVDYGTARNGNETVIPVFQKAAAQSFYHQDSLFSQLSAGFTMLRLLYFDVEAGLAVQSWQFSPYAQLQIGSEAVSDINITLAHYSNDNPQHRRHMILSDQTLEGSSNELSAALKWRPFASAGFTLAPGFMRIFSAGTDSSKCTVADVIFGYENVSESLFAKKGFSVFAGPAYVNSPVSDNSYAFDAGFFAGSQVLKNMTLAITSRYAALSEQSGADTGPRYVLARDVFCSTRQGGSFAWGRIESLWQGGRSGYAGVYPALRCSLNGGAAWDERLVIVDEGEYRNFAASFSGGVLLAHRSLFLSLDAIWPWRYDHAGYPGINFSFTMEL